MKFKSFRPFAVLAALVLLAIPVLAAAPALTPPESAIVEQATAIVDAMKAADRGPYSRLRWYCNDGTIHPPTPYACAERGGGRQHGEYSADREKLANLGWSVGTVFAALSWDEFFDATRRNDRMRQLPIEAYLVAVDDGWVLRRARNYRGRVQVEDEEAAGHGLLVRLLEQSDWLDGNFLLVRELARVVPHHGGTDRTRSIRTLSQEISEEDPTFEQLRIKIHTTPGRGDIASVESWLARARARSAPQARLDKAEKLRGELDALYGSASGWRQDAAAALRKVPVWKELELRLDIRPDAPAVERLSRFSSTLAWTRDQIEGLETLDGVTRLGMLDLSLALEREAVKAAFEQLDRQGGSRADLLSSASDLVNAAYGAGLLSRGERLALAGELGGLLGVTAVASNDYVDTIRALRRVAPWALATVRYTFGESLVRYTALVQEAGRFPDEVLRGSALLPLAEVTTRLATDSDRLTGISHRLFGRTYGGMLGLNPGVATGPLRLLEPDWSGKGLERDQIVVLPRTVAELDPVAGILSLGEGNLLSHIQLLARNLGIPNATLAPGVARALDGKDGRQVLLAVGTDGSIVLEDVDRLPANARDLAVPAKASTGAAPSAKIDAPRPDLAVRRLLPLDDLDASLSGRVVGPKAANLGELARLFPGRVEQAIAIPFGVFYQHLAGGTDSPKARLDRAFAQYRAGRIPEDTLLAEVARIRSAIAETRLSDEFRESLRREMAVRFGPPGTYGVFVRSDTNVEDLPGFTGAGLNETLPHLTEFDKVAAGIARVWSSALSPRALAWRSMILNRPEEVYASVLLMKSVPADKSGVLITADLVGRRPGLTVATAWGVGGAVDGEAAETLVLRPDGGETLVGEAKAPYRRRLEPAGGVAWVPAPPGPVLTEPEKKALRDLAAEVLARREPALGRDGKPLPWDIEFGFVNGQLTLFQIRPLVERGQQRADQLIDSLVPVRAAMPPTIALDETPAVSAP